MTVHALPDLASVGQRRGGRLRMLLLLLVCAAPVLASYFMYFVVRPDGAGAAYGAIIDPPRDLPLADAFDLAGKPVALASLRRQWLVVAVGPSRCDEACERRLYLQRQVREMLGRERERVDKVWLITDDAVMAQPLRRALEATPAMHLLRLPATQADAWLIPAPGQRIDDHLYIVDPMGRLMMRMPTDAQPARVKRDLDRLLRASASWDNAGR
ncbi:MAG: SCO family protein [Aquabacterium sp.]